MKNEQDKSHARTIVLPPVLDQALIKRSENEGRKPAAMVRRILEEVLLKKG